MTDEEMKEHYRARAQGEQIGVLLVIGILIIWGIGEIIVRNFTMYPSFKFWLVERFLN
jgi:hypothetical protein